MANVGVVQMRGTVFIFTARTINASIRSTNRVMTKRVARLVLGLATLTMYMRLYQVRILKQRGYPAHGKIKIEEDDGRTN